VSDVIKFKPRAEDHFGLCPICRRTDGYLNAGRTHVFFCEEHRVCWTAGSNLFSSWRHETDEEQRAAFERIEGFREVTPFFWPRKSNPGQEDTASVIAMLGEVEDAQ
jgi:hypothetical protein